MSRTSLRNRQLQLGRSLAKANGPSDKSIQKVTAKVVEVARATASRCLARVREVQFLFSGVWSFGNALEMRIRFLISQDFQEHFF